jgi:hypothetical protein
MSPQASPKIAALTSCSHELPTQTVASRFCVEAQRQASADALGDQSAVEQPRRSDRSDQRRVIAAALGLRVLCGWFVERLQHGRARVVQKSQDIPRWSAPGLLGVRAGALGSRNSAVRSWLMPSAS